MRQISFSLTTPQVRARTKTVTRRLGWKDAYPGLVLQPVVKGQGIPKGQRVEKIDRPIQILTARRERLNSITPQDVIAEGFPNMTPSEFVAMFCQHNRCRPHAYVTRIEFEYVDGASERQGPRA